MEHDWNAIMRGAVPGGIAVVLVFANLPAGWRWPLTLASMAAAYGLVYARSRKKGDLFTAVATVFLAALVMHFLSKAGMI